MFWVLGNAWASEQTLPQHVSAALPLPADLAKRILEKNRKEATTPTCGEGSGERGWGGPRRQSVRGAPIGGKGNLDYNLLTEQFRVYGTQVFIQHQK